MPERCEIVAYVRSRRAVVSAQIIQTSVPLAAGAFPPVHVNVRRAVVVREWRLDPGQRHALREARGLAAETGNPLRVVDLGRMNPVSRALHRLRVGGSTFPVVVMKGSCPWDRVGRGTPARGGQPARV